ncbi:hypothetical protein PTSG_01615 [Salpingoeca rosetta]|uniref:TNFR-Cys domain-containing protein n=1 Tax=Salpingoeca rosetta (strain ATCC 50818 / BSB-021) TaxID=946362 RepID=F2TYG3_SALR5|nr:uncharacterized protein PTSG_01615 [Salpingoeca rosetta]EGD78637.1 hypothetical protein PTSG_01615 [Salpingoeca rosetta]|eukprot:XP_004997595.1 hypothetical protein PTSG_01615 [Salpingoeca rosetta]
MSSPSLAQLRPCFVWMVVVVVLVAQLLILEVASEPPQGFTDYENTEFGSFDFTCPQNSILVGFYAEPVGVNGDRRYAFKCDTHAVVDASVMPRQPSNPRDTVNQLCDDGPMVSVTSQYNGPARDRQFFVMCAIIDSNIYNMKNCRTENNGNFLNTVGGTVSFEAASDRYIIKLESQYDGATMDRRWKIETCALSCKNGVALTARHCPFDASRIQVTYDHPPEVGTMSTYTCSADGLQPTIVFRGDEYIGSDPSFTPSTLFEGDLHISCYVDDLTGPVQRDFEFAVCQVSEQCDTGFFLSGDCSETTQSVCSPCTDCAIGEHVVQSCTPEQPRTCTACEEGKFSVDINQDGCQVCRVCPDGQYATGECSVSSNTPCEDHTTCGLGRFICDAGNAFKDNECCTCTDGKFQDNPSIFAEKCTPVSTCPAGTYIEVAATPSSNVQCGSCMPPFQYSTEENQEECIDTLVCSSTEVETAAPTSTTNRECARCSSGYADHAISTTDCIAWTECLPGEYEVAPATFSSDRQCMGCSATECLPGSFASTLCGGTHDIECEECTPSCDTSEFIAAECTPTSDILCLNCNEADCDDGQFATCDGVDAICTTCVRCGFGELETAPCTISTDRECLRCSGDVCPPDKYLTGGDCANPTCTNCTVCDPDTAYQFAECRLEGSPVADTVCLSLSTCTSGESFELLPPTPTSDRKCVGLLFCDPDSEFELLPPTATTNRVCVECSQCRDNEYIGTPCTLTSDTECNLCSVCPVGFTETRTCQHNVNTLCEDITKPVIVTDSTPIIVELGTNYNGEGIRATDAVDGELPFSVEGLDVRRTGSQSAMVVATDAAGNRVEVLVPFVIQDTTPPSIATSVPSLYVVPLSELPALRSGRRQLFSFADFDLQSTSVTPAVETLPPGTHAVYASAADGSGNTAHALVTVAIPADDESAFVYTQQDVLVSKANVTAGLATDAFVIGVQTLLSEMLAGQDVTVVVVDEPEGGLIQDGNGSGGNALSNGGADTESNGSDEGTGGDQRTRRAQADLVAVTILMVFWDNSTFAWLPPEDVLALLQFDSFSVQGVTLSLSRLPIQAGPATTTAPNMTTTGSSTTNTAGTPAPSQSGLASSQITIIGACAAALVVGAVIAVVVIRKRRNANDDGAPSNNKKRKKKHSVQAPDNTVHTIQNPVYEPERGSALLTSGYVEPDRADQQGVYAEAAFPFGAPTGGQQGGDRFYEAPVTSTKGLPQKQSSNTKAVQRQLESTYVESPFGMQVEYGTLMSPPILDSTTHNNNNNNSSSSTTDGDDDLYEQPVTNSEYLEVVEGDTLTGSGQPPQAEYEQPDGFTDANYETLEESRGRSLMDNIFK